MVVVEPFVGVRFAVGVVEGAAGVTPGGARAGEGDGATALLELEGLAFLDT